MKNLFLAVCGLFICASPLLANEDFPFKCKAVAVQQYSSFRVLPDQDSKTGYIVDLRDATGDRVVLEVSLAMNADGNAVTIEGQSNQGQFTYDRYFKAKINLVNPEYSGATYSLTPRSIRPPFAVLGPATCQK